MQQLSIGLHTLACSVVVRCLCAYSEETGRNVRVWLYVFVWCADFHLQPQRGGYVDDT